MCTPEGDKKMDQVAKKAHQLDDQLDQVREKMDQAEN